MNAYELADELDTNVRMALIRSQNMLRQQADRIAKLESYLEAYKTRIAELEKEKIRAYDNGYEDGHKSLTTNAKPVAWIRSGDDQLSLVKGKDDGYMIWKPLYSTPQIKERCEPLCKPSVCNCVKEEK